VVNVPETIGYVQIIPPLRKAYWVNPRKRFEIGTPVWAGFETRPYELLTILCWRWRANTKGF
jgi:hypothetical protein